MLDIKWIRENPEALDKALAQRGWQPDQELLKRIGNWFSKTVGEENRQRVITALIQLDEDRRRHIAKLQEAQERRNAASKEIGNAKASGDEARAEALIDEVAKLKDELQADEEAERRLDKALRDALAEIPNVPDPDVPVGKDESANVELHRWGEPPGTGGAERPSNRPDWPDGFKPKEHFDLGERLGMDFETAAKLSGARFVVLKGQLARLERALGQFMLDLHTGEHGYTEIQPPLLVRDEALLGTGQLPKFALDQFIATQLMPLEEKRGVLADVFAETDFESPLGERAHVFAAEWDISDPDDRHWLIPTAEVPLTNLVRESITAEAELPLRFTALTPCFRSEAGAAGQDTRGMMRQHQFDKVELVSITTPEQSKEEHERMLASAEEVLKRLDLHYRVVTLSTGDMGFAAEKTWDIEVWLPGQGRYREISSVSRCGDFQARRMDARYRDGAGKIRHVHTLNGSGVAVGRALIAVLESYQNPDGSVTVPTALAPYMAGIDRIGP